MPTNYGSADAFLYVDGYLMKPQSLDMEIISEMEVNTVIGDTGVRRKPTGVKNAALEQGDAFFDTTTDAIHDALSSSLPTAATDSPRVICAGFVGVAIGAMFAGLKGFTPSYKPRATIGALEKANVGYAPDDAIEHGRILQPLAQQSADWDTEATSVDFTEDPSQRVIPITSNSMANPTVVTTPVAHGLTTGDVVLISGVSSSSPDINGEQTVTVISTTTFSVPVDTSAGSGGTGGQFVRADSSNGGAGYQQVSEATGITNFVGKIRHSADDAAWADLATFADNVSAPYAERVAIAGQIDRYTAYDGNLTGVGTITAFAGLHRNP